MKGRRSNKEENVRPKDVRPEMVPAEYVQGLEGRMYLSLPERPRYLTLSDGQVLDRLVPPIAELTRIHQMRMCNESAYNYHPSKGMLSRELKARL